MSPKKTAATRRTASSISRFPQAGGGGGAFGRGQTGCAPAPQGQAAAQGGGRAGRGGRGAAAAATAAETPACRSFDGKWMAVIENYNIFLRSTGSNEPATPLSFDGSEGNYYTLRSVAWSPDSKKLVAYHTRPGYDRQVHYIQSSPADQVQPKHFTTNTLPNAAISGMYRKPGDALDIAYPALFDIATKKEIEIDHALFPNPYDITPPVWWKDSRAFTFEYNQRGHQVYRVIEVDAQTGKTRPVIDEQSKTFIYYNLLGTGLSAGRRYRHDLNDGKEIVWASERDGWEHLYLYDAVTGRVKNQITKGDWLVRNVDYVDDDKRQIYFEAGGLIRRTGPLLHAILPHQFRWHGLDQTHRRQRHAHGDLLARPQILCRYVAARRSAAAGTASPHRRPEGNRRS